MWPKRDGDDDQDGERPTIAHWLRAASAFVLSTWPLAYAAALAGVSHFIWRRFHADGPPAADHEAAREVASGSSGSNSDLFVTLGDRSVSANNKNSPILVARDGKSPSRQKFFRWLCADAAHKLQMLAVCNPKIIKCKLSPQFVAPTPIGARFRSQFVKQKRGGAIDNQRIVRILANNRRYRRRQR